MLMRLDSDVWQTLNWFTVPQKALDCFGLNLQVLSAGQIASTDRASVLLHKALLLNWIRASIGMSRADRCSFFFVPWIRSDYFAEEDIGFDWIRFGWALGWAGGARRLVRRPPMLSPAFSWLRTRFSRKHKMRQRLSGVDIPEESGIILLIIITIIIITIIIILIIITTLYNWRMLCWTNRSWVQF